MPRTPKPGFRGQFAMRWDDEEEDYPLINLRRVLYLSREGRAFEIPSGFKTDLASVPRAARSFAPSKIKSAKAALLHDFLYATQEVTRREADALFYEALRLTGVGLYDSWKMWLSVRLFGGLRWRRGKRVPGRFVPRMERRQEPDHHEEEQ